MPSSWEWEFQHMNVDENKYSDHSTTSPPLCLLEPSQFQWNAFLGINGEKFQHIYLVSMRTDKHLTLKSFSPTTCSDSQHTPQLMETPTFQILRSKPCYPLWLLSSFSIMNSSGGPWALPSKYTQNLTTYYIHLTTPSQLLPSWTAIILNDSNSTSHN